MYWEQNQGFYIWVLSIWCRLYILSLGFLRINKYRIYWFFRWELTCFNRLTSVKFIIRVPGLVIFLFRITFYGWIGFSPFLVGSSLLPIFLLFLFLVLITFRSRFSSEDFLSIKKLRKNIIFFSFRRMGKEINKP